MNPTIIRHRTLEACVAAYFHVPIKRCFSLRFPRKSFWEFYDGKGKRHCWSMARTLRIYRKWGVWGWVEGKRRIHLWVAPYATFVETARLLAHELGHVQKPHLSPADEERKAARYKAVATLAVKIAARLTETRMDRKRRNP